MPETRLFSDPNAVRDILLSDLPEYSLYWMGVEVTAPAKKRGRRFWLRLTRCLPPRLAAFVHRWMRRRGYEAMYCWTLHKSEA